jgi:hypothetical protein
VQCEAAGLSFLQAQARQSSQGIYMANGVADTFPLQPFPIRVLNNSHRERKLTKGMVLGHALPHPTGTVALVDEDFAETLDPPAMPLSPESSYSQLPDRPDVGRRTLERGYESDPPVTAWAGVSAEIVSQTSYHAGRSTRTRAHQRAPNRPRPRLKADSLPSVPGRTSSTRSRVGGSTANAEGRGH